MPAEPLHAAALGRLVAGEVVQVLAGGAAACPGERDRLAAGAHRSLLRVPITCQGTLIGTLEAYRTTERPWSRLEISSARIIAHQLGAALELLHGNSPGPAAERDEGRAGDWTVDLVLDPDAGKLLEARSYEHGRNAEPIPLTVEAQCVVDTMNG